MTTREIVVATDFVAEATDWIARTIERALSERERASVALSGGSTPGPIYGALAERVDWERVDVYFGDERCVAPDHPDSTYRLVRETLLDRLPHAPRVLRMEGEDPDHDAAARRYEELLPERIDLAVQGMGEDGHTASLFPGHPALAETQRRVLHVVGPKPPPDRLTLTPPALRSARSTVVLTRGVSKAETVRRALEGPLDVGALPVQLVRDGAWILDPGAAAALTGESL